MKLYSQTELEACTGIPARTWSQWRYRDKGPCYVKIGRHVRYRLEDVDTWLESRIQGGDAEGSAL